ncbi:hypothetical protein IT575_09000 [bacterium]|nr:hypothetical protein [bacterium]
MLSRPNKLCRPALALLAAAALLLPAGGALAAQTRSQLTMLINERGAVEVVDRWTGLAQQEGTFEYFSAAREIGTVPVRIKDGSFTLSFKTRSYLRYEDGAYFFVTPDFYYKDGPLDVDLALTYPPNLVLIEASPTPTYEGKGVLHWELKDCQHTIVMAKFDRVGPFVDPGRSGPDYQVDPRVLSVLSQEELPGSADETLKELENIIKVAQASQSSDPDFIRVLEKLLAKFYYIYDSNGLLLDYKPASDGKAADADAAAEKPAEEPETEPAAEDSDADEAKPRHKPKAKAGP